MTGGEPPFPAAAAAWPWLAHAIARRPMIVRAAGEGRTTYGDGTTIVVAGRDQPADSVALVVHSLLARSDSLADGTLRALRGRPAVARRYLLLEALRLGQELEFVVPQWFSESLTQWAQVPRSVDAAHSWRRAEGAERLPDPPPEWGTIIGRRGTDIRPAGADNTLTGEGRRRDSDADPDEETERSRILRFLSAPLPGNTLSTFFKNRRGVRGESRGGIGGANLPDGDEITVATSATEYVVRSAAGRLGERASIVVRAHRYPEWDVGRGRYLPAWCQLFEVAPKRTSELFSAVTPSPLLQTRLRRIALSAGPRRGAVAGDQIDFDSLVEHRVLRRAGQRSDDARVYIDRVRRRPDVSLTVIVDVSSSTRERRGSRSVLDEEKDLCDSLLDAGQAIDLRTSAFGFCSNGRETVFAVRIKSFDEPFGQSVRRRLAGLEPSGFTRIGAAIRHATATIPAASGTARNALLLLTDGFPYDDAYENDHASADTARALAEARLAGVHSACLAVGSDRNADRLAELFDGAGAHAATIASAGALSVIADLIEVSLRARPGDRRRLARSAGQV